MLTLNISLLMMASKDNTLALIKQLRKKNQKVDIPTGWKVTKENATKTVTETLRRAKAFFKTKTRSDILWVGPVQGGRHLDLVAKSAVAMGKLPFQIHAFRKPNRSHGKLPFRCAC